MKKNLCATATLVLLFLTSCAPMIRNLQPTGDKADLATHAGGGYVGELLMVTDSTICFRLASGKSVPRASWQRGEIVSISLADVQSITVKGYVNRRWIGAVIAFELVPSVLLAAAASAAEAEAGTAFLIGAVPTFLTFVAFAASTPSPPQFQAPFTPEKVEQLKAYVRFPQGLTPRQLEQLLARNQQQTPVKIH